MCLVTAQQARRIVGCTSKAFRAAVLFGLIAVLSALQLSRPMSSRLQAGDHLVRSKIVAFALAEVRDAIKETSRELSWHPPLPD